MRSSAVRTTALLTAVAALTAACTTEQPGKGMAASPTSAAPKTTTTEKKPRPEEIKLDGIDPCQVLTDEQMKQLSVSRRTRMNQDLVKDGSEDPVCNYGNNSSPRIIYGVGLVIGSGIDHWTGNGNVDVKPTTVGGYSAVTLTFKGAPVDCALAIDIAGGQQFYFDYEPGQAAAQDVMCQNAVKGAELALATLQTLK
ncbi:hypothetical protein GCM10022243_52000 [Saccharothrix violaceirubra]|uniref:DUF3558 domain-containing protein n=1 Tax=Saccharothrix violaceirubra TaxID=413306 RepID=A0A7W7WZE0_9PSEU|nr:DUF3558 domain-containing protein [Saccharothrix violaceirubra]MBB4969499.1 hypothetical protein [Saccharothrix violaceirubra]